MTIKYETTYICDRCNCEITDKKIIERAKKYGIIIGIYHILLCKSCLNLFNKFMKGGKKNV